MYTYQTKDCGLLFCALTYFKDKLEKDLKIDSLPLEVVQDYTRRIERLQQILEEL